jgi:hypothetical protein
MPVEVATRKRASQESLGGVDVIVISDDERPSIS